MKFRKFSRETRTVKNPQAPDFQQSLLECNTFPVCLSATNRYPDAETIGNRFAQKEEGMIYSRLGNASLDAFAAKIAHFEGAEAGLCFSSGMASIANMILSLVKSGENIVVSHDVYGGTHKLITNDIPNWGIETRRFNGTDLNQLEDMIDEKTRLVFIETPSNPTMSVVDIAEISKIAKKHNVPVAVDNTFCTPLYQRPLELGADIIIHSATKYLAGHGNVIAGALVSSKEIVQKIFDTTFYTFGSILAPFEAWLVLNGMQSLEPRMEKHSKNAMRIAQFLEKHPKVKQVWYPGLESHPQHEIAKKQMSGFGGMLAFEVDGDREITQRFVDSTEVCERLISLGECVTIICHSASTTHSLLDAESLKEIGISEGFVRLSVGIENADELIADLDQALAQMSSVKVTDISVQQKSTLESIG